MGLAAGLLWVAVWWSGMFGVYELALYDARMELRGERPGRSADLTILAIDDTTYGMTGWPWPRDVYGLLTRWLFECGGDAVAYDVIFSEERSYEAEKDAEFAEAIGEGGPVYLASALQRERAELYSAAEKAAAAERTENLLHEDSPQLRSFRERVGRYRERYALDPARMDTRSGDALDSLDALLPAPPFLAAASGVGFTVIPPDPDGKNRRVPLVMQYEGDYYPSLHLLLVCRRLGVDFRTVQVRFGKHLTIPGTPRGDVRVPVDERGRMLLDFYDAEVKRYFGAVSAADLIDAMETLRALEDAGILPARLSRPDELIQVAAKLEEAGIRPAAATRAAALAAEFDGRLALVGVTATALTDIRPIPLAGAYPMVGTVATAVQNMLEGRFLRQAPRGWDAAAVLVLGLLIGALGIGLRGARYALAALGALGLYAAGAYALLAYRGLWVDALHPLASGATAYVGAALAAYVLEQREKAAIKSVFSRVVNKEVMEELLADPEALALGGASRQVTILFTDIKGFTALSEAMPPAGVVELLNEYFTEMVEIVFKHGGMLDKYIGDAMMLVFGAPRPYGSRDEAPRRAVRCAVEMQKKMRDLQASYRQRGLPMLRMRIGVNTGEVVAGNIGSIKRLEYSVIGDAVNLASRLEANAPVDGVLISEDTYRHVADEVIAQRKPPLVVKGRQQPVEVYEIFDVKEPADEAVTHPS